MPDRWAVDPDHPDGRVVPYTADEKTQHRKDRKAAADLEKAEAETAAANEKLLKKLTSGKASDAEVQAALARLLTG